MGWEYKTSGPYGCVGAICDLCDRNVYYGWYELYDGHKLVKIYCEECYKNRVE